SKEVIRSIRQGRPVSGEARIWPAAPVTEADFWDALRAADPATLRWEVDMSYRGDGDLADRMGGRLVLDLDTYGDGSTDLIPIPYLLTKLGRLLVANAQVGWEYEDPYLCSRKHLAYGLHPSWEEYQRPDALLEMLRALTERVQPYIMRVCIRG